MIDTVTKSQYPREMLPKAFVLKNIRRSILKIKMIINNQILIMKI